MPFKPGQSGNPAGWPKGKSQNRRVFARAARKLIGRKDDYGSRHRDIIIQGLIDLARRQDMDAIKQLILLVDGKQAPISVPPEPQPPVEILLTDATTPSAQPETKEQPRE